MPPASSARSRVFSLVISGSQNTTAYDEPGEKAVETPCREWEDPNNPQKKRLACAALRQLGAPKSVQLLDLGCGNGSLTHFFHTLGYQVHGVDISEALIKHNRERFPQINFEVVRPASPVPFGDARFDAVFCSEVIEHIYDVQYFFSELSRLLRIGGLLILTTPYHGLVKNVLIALFFFERHFDPNWEHIRFWSKKSLSRRCLAHGLKPVLWKRIGRFWPVSKSFFVVCRREDE